MKALTLTIAALTITTATHATCTLTLKTKTPTAKTHYLGSDSISKSTLAKLAKHCTINKVLMSKQEVKALNIAKLEAKLKKLKGSK